MTGLAVQFLEEWHSLIDCRTFQNPPSFTLSHSLFMQQNALHDWFHALTYCVALLRTLGRRVTDWPDVAVRAKVDRLRQLEEGEVVVGHVTQPHVKVWVHVDPESEGGKREKGKGSGQ